MKKIALMAAIVGMCTSAFAHIPEGRVFGVFQFPTDKLPVLDGDISEWDVVPDEMWIDLDDPDIVVGEGDVGHLHDVLALGRDALEHARLREAVCDFTLDWEPEKRPMFYTDLVATRSSRCSTRGTGCATGRRRTRRRWTSRST